MKKIFQKIILNIRNFLQKASVPDLLFVIIIVVIIVIPSTKFNKQRKDVVEKRLLAQAPVLIKDGRINKSFSREFENFYNDRFRKRGVCIDICLSIKAFTNGRRENTLAMEGLDGWYFYKGDYSVENFQNKILFNDYELKKIKTNLDKLNEFCKMHKIKLIVIIPPDKNRIYGEYYPKNIKKINPKSRVELLKEYLSNNNGIEIIYPVDELLAYKNKTDEKLYFYADTHWTRYGSYIGYLSLMEAISSQVSKNLIPADISKYDGPKIDYFEFTGGAEGAFDLLKMKGKQTERIYKFPYYPVDGYKPIKYPYKICLFGDSFSVELGNWLQESFNIKRLQYNENLTDNSDFSMAVWEKNILEEKPDILIVEFLERFSFMMLDLYKD